MDAAALPIRTRRQSECHVCGGAGDIAYSGLCDRIFGVSGEWTLRRCLDPGCGLLWLDPMPVEEDLPRLYENYYTHSELSRPSPTARIRQAIKRAYWSDRYGYTGSSDIQSAVITTLVRLFPGVRAQFDLQVFELPATEGGRLLDIGCGGGAAMKRMAGLGWQVEGVDFDEKAVQYARSNGLDVRLGSVEAQAYPADTFDAVVMSHVLEHVPNPRALLLECQRILRPGGRLVSITPNASSWCHKVYESDWRGLEPPRHLHIFSAASLRNLARHLGWSSLVVNSTIANTHGLAWASKRIKHDGRHDMDSRPGFFGRIGARLIQMNAAARHSFDPDIGEEIVLHAVKPAKGD